MYWPLGTPRTYVVPKRPEFPADDSDDEDQEPASPPMPLDETILGLRVSRNGQIMATITATTLDIWQTSVRPSLPSFAHPPRAF